MYFDKEIAKKLEPFTDENGNIDYNILIQLY